MDAISAQTSNVADPEMVCFHEGTTSDDKDMEEVGRAMEVLTKVDLELAYSSEKLLNLETLLLHVLTWENDLEAMAADDISVECIEKALTFDFLSSILESEVREVDNSMGSIQIEIVDAREKISPCRHLGELFAVVEGKLYDSDESLKKALEHVLDMKMQLAKLQMTSLAFNYNNWRYNTGKLSPERLQVSKVDLKPQTHTFEKAHALRMLEKSLARELELEKKLTESMQNEEDLKLKLRLTEQVAFCMEEAAEVVWGRFLEAENAAEVLMGISKDLVGRHQIVQFNLNGFSQREDDIKSKLSKCIEQMHAKEVSLEKLNTRFAQLVADNSAGTEKITLLEEKLRESELKLKKANASYVESQEQLREMESMIESLKESIDAAESRAETAEGKIAQLTESNIELTEELGFLKGSNDSSAEKMSLLEKQSRDLELQLQHARASSEAGQEQQNMLYSAIWDMETLIDELKQKVSKAEIGTENAEERCIILSDTNFELSKEVDYLRARVESLETSLNQANVEKIASAKDINIKSNLIMDMVMQLATERKRIQNQLYSLTEEKRSLMEQLQMINKDMSASIPQHGLKDTNLMIRRHGMSNGTCAETLTEVSTESLSKSIEVDEMTEETPELETISKAPTSTNEDSHLAVEANKVAGEGRDKRMYLLLTILVLILSALASYLHNLDASFIHAYVG